MPCRPFLPAILLTCLAGCSASSRTAQLIPMAELAQAAAIRPVLLARLRISFDRPLPPSLVDRLCTEFSLVTVRTSQDWTELCRRLQIQDLARPNLSAGCVVGLLAEIGESACSDWPASIEWVRTRDGVGWLEATFEPGLYFPLRTAGYLELAYVRGLQEVAAVRVGSRVFVLPTREVHPTPTPVLLYGNTTP